MSKARIEILKLIAEGKISPEEGERLLNELDDSGGSTEAGRTVRIGEAIGQVLEEVGETVRRAVYDAIGAAHKIFDEHRAETESVAVGEGRFDMPPGARLRVQQAIRVSFGGGSKGGNVILRALGQSHVRILRGEAIEVHRNGSDYVLTWAKGNLELEVPQDLAGLEVRCMGGDLEIHDFVGPMMLDTTGGELRVLSPRAPFRFRTLGGRMRIVDLDLREGPASISTTGGDVRIEAAAGASVTIRVGALGGSIDFPPGCEPDTQGRARRRAVCVIGEGKAELKVDTLGGDVHIRHAPAAP